MEHTYESLKKMTVAQLREIAAGIQHESVSGYSTMHKEKLVPSICHALGIIDHVHHEVVGVNKIKLKAEIRKLKKERDEALKAGERTKFKETLRQIHDLKVKIRRSMV
jgi:tetratricopeptide (TPR) repeat protein